MLRKLVVTASVVSVGLLGATSALAADSISGKRTPSGGCTFTSKTTAAAGQQLVRTFDVDIASCSASVAVDAGAPADSAGAVAAGAASQQAAQLFSADGVGALATYAARSATQVEDFNRNFQHSVTNGVRWSSNGRQLTGAQCFYYTVLYNGNLWGFEGRSDRPCAIKYVRGVPKAVLSRTFASFGSPAGFYCGSPTRIQYNYHTSQGNVNGSITDIVRFTGFGCSFRFRHLFANGV